jgi:hypothetical protein
MSNWTQKGRTSGKFVSVGDGERDVPEFKGLLLGFVRNEKYGKNDFLFRNGDGEEVVVNSSKYLTDACSVVGAVYHIVFKGRVASKRGQPMKLFDVFESQDPEVIELFAGVEEEIPGA